MEGVIELRNRTTIHRDGLILKPGANLLFFEIRPSGKTICQQLGLASDGRRFGHERCHALYAATGAQTIPNSNRLMAF